MPPWPPSKSASAHIRVNSANLLLGTDPTSKPRATIYVFKTGPYYFEIRLLCKDLHSTLCICVLRVSLWTRWGGIARLLAMTYHY